MSMDDEITEEQYYSELESIILQVIPTGMDKFVNQLGEYLEENKQSEDFIVHHFEAITISIQNLRDIALHLARKLADSRSQHRQQVYILEDGLLRQKEQIAGDQQKLEEFYKIYDAMEEKNSYYQRVSYELEIKCDQYESELSEKQKLVEAAARQLDEKQIDEITIISSQQNQSCDQCPEKDQLIIFLQEQNKKFSFSSPLLSSAPQVISSRNRKTQITNPLYSSMMQPQFQNQSQNSGISSLLQDLHRIADKQTMINSIQKNVFSSEALISPRLIIPTIGSVEQNTQQNIIHDQSQFERKQQKQNVEKQDSTNQTIIEKAEQIVEPINSSIIKIDFSSQTDNNEQNPSKSIQTFYSSFMEEQETENIDCKNSQKNNINQEPNKPNKIEERIYLPLMEEISGGNFSSSNSPQNSNIYKQQSNSFENGNQVSHPFFASISTKDVQAQIKVPSLTSKIISNIRLILILLALLLIPISNFYFQFI